MTRKGSDVVVLRLDGSGPALDVGNVFDLIPRSRIAEVAADGRTLTLRLACRCAIDTFRTETGYLAVDVGRPSSSDPVVEPAIALPLRLEAPSILTAPIQNERAEVPAEIDRPRPPQFTVHDRRPTDFLPRQDPKPKRASTDAADACRFEGIARAIIDTDPLEALAGLTGMRADLLDGQDAFDRDAARRLADHYLAIGWGAEALSILDRMGDDDVDRRRLGTAMDSGGSAEPADLSPPDPTCGPASALTFLILEGTANDWQRADEEAAMRYLDRLPPMRRGDFLPLVRNGLSKIGRAERLAGISDPTRPSAPPASHPAEAGTGLQAIRKLHSRLKRANAQLREVEEIWLVNGMALRPSLPPGSLRDDFEMELTKALVAARHLADATMLAKGHPERAESAIRTALDVLAPEDAVEAVVRMARYLPDDAAVAPPARDLLLAFGLTAMARADGLANGPAQTGQIAPTIPANQADGVQADHPWLRRDLTGAADDRRDIEPERARVADAILDRNRNQPAPQSDYAQAEGALADSREMRSALEALLTDGPAL